MCFSVCHALQLSPSTKIAHQRGLRDGRGQSVSVCYKETPKGPADPMQAPGPNPCPALVTRGATNLPQVSPTA
jgi:hypothetical protein